MSFRLLPLLLLFAACNSQPPDLSEQSRKEILQADMDMSDRAVKDGFNKALLSFADDSLVKLDDDRLPIIGKKALEASTEGKEGTKGISWKPLKAEAAQSGELGYTFGNWKFVTTDTTYYGNYFTVWKKQADGEWRWSLDGGNNTPAPQ